MRSNTRLFLVLWLAGMVGVLSLLLIDLEELLRILPLPADAEIPMSIPVLKAVSMVQPAVLVAAAVLIGVTLAPKVGLLSPVAEAAANGGDVVFAIKAADRSWPARRLSGRSFTRPHCGSAETLIV